MAERPRPEPQFELTEKALAYLDGNPGPELARIARSIATLDAISRKRSLTDAESLHLEKLIKEGGQRSMKRTLPHRALREAARLGIKRDMRSFG